MPGSSAGADREVEFEALGQSLDPDTVVVREALTDREIDRLVYELYGLTTEEIAIVEAATK